MKIKNPTNNLSNCQVGLMLTEINQLVDFLDIFGSSEQQSKAQDLCFAEYFARHDFRNGNITGNQLIEVKTNCVCGIKRLVAEAMQQ